MESNVLGAPTAHADRPAVRACGRRSSLDGRHRRGRLGLSTRASLESPSPSSLREADRAAIATLTDVVSTHSNTTSWWNNASFALPALGAVLCLGGGALFGSPEALGFGGFLAFVTLVMLPVVRITWRRTPTAVVLTREAVLSLHEGRTLREIPWADLARIERADYDNIKYRLRPREGDHISIEAELEDLDTLIVRASELSGLPPTDRPR